MGAGRILAACGLGIAALTLGVGSAAADTAPAPDPGAEMLAAAPVEGPPVPADPFTVTSAQSKDNPIGTLAGLLGNQPADSTPAVPNPMALANQSVGLTGTPAVDPLASVSALFAHNFRMPSEDSISPYVLQTNVPAGPFARVDALKGAHAVVHGALGRVPGSELGQALPGTAPAAGSNLPPGLEQFYVPPEAPADVPPPVPPFPLATPVG